MELPDEFPAMPGDETNPPERKRRFSLLKPGLLAGKALLVVVVIAVLNVGVKMVEGLVYEREARFQNVSREVGALWGGRQTLAGPVLAVPYGVAGERPGAEHAIEQGTAYVLPEQLDIESELAPETRHRGIFEAVVYTMRARVSGHFRKPTADSLTEAGVPRDEDVILLWDRAVVAFGVPDMRSIRKVVEVRLNGSARRFVPGTRMRGLLGSGMSVDVPPDGSDGGEADTLSFEFELGLNGSQGLSFLPFGRETRVTVRSPWPAPSFAGAYLPATHDISQDGFTAAWTLSHFARDYPQTLLGPELPESTGAQIQASAFGVNLHQPVTTYRKVQRAIKYGLLFLVFTFGFYFLVEIVSKRRIHPVQYALVGVPLCLFYLLLVSFAEHIGFDTAYVTGSACVIALVSLYSMKVLASARRAAVIASLLAGLYAYLYMLLQQENYSLLGGSLGLLLLTAAFMYATRNVNWYGTNGAAGTQAQPAKS